MSIIVTVDQLKSRRKQFRPTTMDLVDAAAAAQIFKTAAAAIEGQFTCH